MSSTPIVKKWFVVHTYSGFENKAKKSLEEKIKQEVLGEFFGDILIPMENVVEMVKGEKRASKRKFFPGYILVQMELNDRTWHLVKNTPKITGFGPADAPGTYTPDGALYVRWTVSDGNGVCRLIVTPLDRRSPPRVTDVPRCSILTEATITVTDRFIVSIGQDGQHEEDQRYLVNVLDLNTGTLTVDQRRYEQVTKSVRNGYLLVVDDRYQAGALDLATWGFTPYGLSAPGEARTLGAPVDWLEGDGQ